MLQNLLFIPIILLFALLFLHLLIWFLPFLMLMLLPLLVFVPILLAPRRYSEDFFPLGCQGVWKSVAGKV